LTFLNTASVYYTVLEGFIYMEIERKRLVVASDLHNAIKLNIY